MQAAFAWTMTLGLIGLFTKLFRRERAWVRYLSDASYWIYLAHMPLVFLLQGGGALGAPGVAEARGQDRVCGAARRLRSSSARRRSTGCSTAGAVRHLSAIARRRAASHRGVRSLSRASRGVAGGAPGPRPECRAGSSAPELDHPSGSVGGIGFDASHSSRSRRRRRDGRAWPSLERGIVEVAGSSSTRGTRRPPSPAPARQEECREERAVARRSVEVLFVALGKLGVDISPAAA